MQPPQQPQPPQEPQPQPQSQQPPAWALYDVEHKHGPIRTTWFDRQMEVYRADLRRWSKRLNMPVPALMAVLAALLLCACSFWSIAGVSALMSPSTPSSANASTTATTAPSAPTATYAPIVSLAPTVTPGPSPTPAPTVTPQPSPTPLPPSEIAKAAIAAQLQADGQTTDGLKVTWDASTKTLTVEHNASDNLTNDFIKTGIQLDAFAVMKAAYTKWGGHPDTVIFHDNGPTQDKYGNNGTGAWGTAVLNSDTAALFNWGNLDYAQAWNAYDVAYYISGL